MFDTNRSLHAIPTRSPRTTRHVGNRRGVLARLATPAHHLAGASRLDIPTTISPLRAYRRGPVGVRAGRRSEPDHHHETHQTTRPPPLGI